MPGSATMVLRENKKPEGHQVCLSGVFAFELFRLDGTSVCRRLQHPIKASVVPKSKNTTDSAC